MEAANTPAKPTLATVISASITLSFLLSVCFEWGFLSALGLTFADVPTTFSDHAQSALVWAPGMVTGLVGAALIEWLSRRIERGQSEEELIGTGPYQSFGRILRGSQGVLGWVVFFAMGFAFLVGGERVAQGGAIVLALICFKLALWIFEHQRVSEQTPPTIRLFVLVAPATMILFYGFGWDHGLRRSALIATTAEPSVLTLRADTAAKRIRVLRNYERGLLYVSGGNIEFRQWSEITSISKPARRTITLGPLCEFVKCNDDKPGARQSQ